MEASDNQLSITLPQGVTEITIEAASDHQTAIEEHLAHACQHSFEQGRRQEAAALRSVQHAEALKKQAETQRILHALTKAVPEMLRDAESAVKDLALCVAQKFVSTCPVTEERIETLVREALAGIHGSSKIVITLHPDDLELIQDTSQALGQESGHSQDIIYKTSSQLTRGGCQVETDFGRIDATIESKTAQINSLLTGPSLAA